MILMEVHNMANKLKRRSALLDDNCSLTTQYNYALKEEGKVAHIQSYFPDPNGFPTL